VAFSWKKRDGHGSSMKSDRDGEEMLSTWPSVTPWFTERELLSSNSPQIQSIRFAAL
jgi:hypothetical protein